MLKNTRQLKGFIDWARSAGLQKVKLGDIEFEFSQAAMIEKYIANDVIKTEPESTSKTMVDAEPNAAADDEEALFWSAR